MKKALKKAPVEQPKPTAEDRVAEIAEKIGECARDLKIRPSDLVWADFRAYGSIAFGQSRIGLLGKELTRLGGFNAIRDQYFPPEPTDQGITRLRLREHANLNRRLGKDIANESFIIQEMQKQVIGVFKGRVEPYRTERSRARRKGETTRINTLLLSDLHFGSDLLAEETGFLDYGKVEEGRRLAQVVQQAIEYKIEHRSEAELRLLLNGDIIHGGLHDARDGAVRSEQISRAIHLLSQAVAQLSQHYRRIDVHCVTGNHGRDLARHHGRATVGKYDSHETVIYSAVRMCCSKLSNVTFNIPKTPYAVYEVFGKKIFVTHGDTVIKPGNPGRAVQTGSLENQVNRWNSTLSDSEEYCAFLVGHVHTPLKTQLANGAYVVVNGALIPADNFCVSIGIPETVCAQVIFESVPGHPVGDSRFITLDRSVDKNEALDAIIKPWGGY
jgi:UDP-2,3-diacylglucosamine pyrophosphatase LpxH